MTDLRAPVQASTAPQTSNDSGSGTASSGAGASVRQGVRDAGTFAAQEALLQPNDGKRNGVVQRKVADVKHLEALTTPGTETESITAVPEAMEKNTVAADTPLPWTKTGWDAKDLLTRLGQYDRLAGTDSDSKRCVQAVALASHIVSGPAAVAAFLGNAVSAGLKKGPLTQRVDTAMKVLGEVKALVGAKTATFGDLSWAQEALHDMSLGDKVGTPIEAIADAVVPEHDAGVMQKLDIWCASAGEVLGHTSSLKEGQQLLVTQWTVSFNAHFDDTDGDEIEVIPEGPDGKTSAPVTIKRIATKTKPPATAFDPKRDKRNGHQLLLYKTGGRVWMYDPETTVSGQHLSEVAKDGAALAGTLKEQPRYGMFGYIEILGKITPAA